MLPSDLEAARSAWLKTAETAEQRAAWEASDFLKYEDRQGHRADFHALRVAYVTMLSNSGVDTKSLQQLARHSTPMLTLGTYARPSPPQVARHVDVLGKLLSPGLGPQLTASGPADGLPSDRQSDWSRAAQDGLGRHSAASVRADAAPEPRPPAEPESPTIPGVFAGTAGAKRKRLRSESNRRWRICNPLP